MNVGETICFAALVAAAVCRADVPEKWTLEDESVRLEVFSATGDLVLSDKRCDRVWRTWRSPWSAGLSFRSARQDGKALYTGEVPAKFVKYMVGERYRIPLWELVYHDCCAAYHYWGGANNKIPSLWRKRDLFDAFYGTPPLYIVAKARWATEKDRLAESYALLEPIARETGFSEMLSHEWLADDGGVQRTTFANGRKVTVDFRAGMVRCEK